jgi:hypothetical protein
MHVREIAIHFKTRHGRAASLVRCMSTPAGRRAPARQPQCAVTHGIGNASQHEGIAWRSGKSACRPVRAAVRLAEIKPHAYFLTRPLAGARISRRSFRYSVASREFPAEFDIAQHNAFILLVTGFLAISFLSNR